MGFNVIVAVEWSFKTVIAHILERQLGLLRSRKFQQDCQGTGQQMRMALQVASMLENVNYTM